MFSIIKNLRKNKKRVLGMNERNLVYIWTYNSKRSIEIADDKILTKKVLSKANIPTPKLINVINNYKELASFDWDSLPNSFVMKPVNGLEGGGIEIYYNRNKDGKWIKSNKTKVSVEELKVNAKEILDGRFSLNQMPDRVLFEERIKAHKVFKYYTYKGTPDIRVIVFNGVPVMSFLRLPTEQSQGKANLALGAIGAGIDMANGTTTTAIQGKARYITKVPGSKLPISGLKIPYWNKILRYAIKAQNASELKFLAVDFLIDRETGPTIVELNARPGLSIQIANDDGLRWRLKKMMDLKVNTVKKGVQLGKYLFGGEIEDDIETISGKEVLGIYENVSLIDAKRAEIKTKAKIDTGADSTSIDKALAEKLGFKDLINKFEEFTIPPNKTKKEYELIAENIKQELNKEFGDLLVDINVISSSHGISLRPVVKVNLKIKDTVIETNANIYDRSKLIYPIIVGRKSLTKFLVDPSKIENI